MSYLYLSSIDWNFMSSLLPDSQEPPLSPLPKATIAVALTSKLTPADLSELCEATVSAIEAGGGFGWVEPPCREVLERFWQGVSLVPERYLFVGRIDGVIAASCQLVKEPKNNEAQSFSGKIMTFFVAPWARHHGLGKLLLRTVEDSAKALDIDVLNLDVRATQDFAIQLYETAGFERWGTNPNYAKIHGKIIPGHYYTKKI